MKGGLQHKKEMMPTRRRMWWSSQNFSSESFHLYPTIWMNLYLVHSEQQLCCVVTMSLIIYVGSKLWAPPSIFGTPWKPSTRMCAFLLFCNFQSNGAKLVIKFMMIFVLEIEIKMNLTRFQKNLKIRATLIKSDKMFNILGPTTDHQYIWWEVGNNVFHRK